MMQAREMLALFKQGAVSSDDVHRFVCQLLQTELNVSRVELWFFNALGDAITRGHVVSRVEGYSDEPVRISEDDAPSYFQYLRDGFKIVAPDVARHPATRALDDQHLACADVCSLLDVLVSVGHDPVAVICAEQIATYRDWTDSDVRLVERMAAVVRATFTGRASSSAPAAA